MVVSGVSTIPEFKGLCELGICDPRCISKKVRPSWVNVFISLPFFNIWCCVCGI